jgi:hypothetical protein
MSSQLESAAEERRRAEALREALQKERDSMLSELRAAESEASLQHSAEPEPDPWPKPEPSS